MSKRKTRMLCVAVLAKTSGMTFPAATSFPSAWIAKAASLSRLPGVRREDASNPKIGVRSPVLEVASLYHVTADPWPQCRRAGSICQARNDQLVVGLGGEPWASNAELDWGSDDSLGTKSLVE